MRLGIIPVKELLALPDFIAIASNGAGVFGEGEFLANDQSIPSNKLDRAS